MKISLCEGSCAFSGDDDVPAVEVRKVRLNSSHTIDSMYYALKRNI